MKILITSGGTSESIDQIRAITNTSTGRTARFLAENLSHLGHEIYYIHSNRIDALDEAQENIAFTSSDDLDKKLKTFLAENSIDLIIHAAAVSDFIVDKVVINGELFSPELLSKIDSSDEIEVILKRRSKIIRELKNYSKKSNPTVIGFKLTNTKEPLDQLASVIKLSEMDCVDFVVHNDLSEISNTEHKTKIYFKDVVMFEGNTKEDLFKNLTRVMDLIMQNKNILEDSYA